MPGVVEDTMETPVPTPAEYTILKQRVDLDIDFARRAVYGTTEITIQPAIKDLKHVKLHCRQSRLVSVQAGGITARYDYIDPYRRAHMPSGSTIYQHEMLRSKLETSLQPAPEPELIITLPQKLKIQELHVDPVTALPQYDRTPSLQRQETDAMAATEMAAAPVMAQSLGPQFAPIKLFLQFEVDSFRDGLHWIGCDDSDRRFPCVYTKSEPWPGNTSCIFPCADDLASRYTWEISIRLPRTLGDAFREEAPVGPSIENGANQQAAPPSQPQYTLDLDETEAALDWTVVSVGEQIEDLVDATDESRRIVTFALNEPVAARHVGFAIGPFEHVELFRTREPEEEERLGQSAVKADGFCLPGRSAELRNTCLPVTKTIDSFGVTYGSFPFPNYQIVFIDDYAHDAIALAGLSICSSHLLFPEDVIEPLERNTRKIIRTVADQWMGVYVVAKDPTDEWAVAGVAGFMTDLFGKTLFGNNAYRWQQKIASERVYDQDVDRPSISQLGHLLHLDPSIREFLDMKSALVLFILDRRLLKANGSSGMGRVISRIFLNAKTGSLVNGELSTADLQRICEKFGHNKLESFFRQWVFGAGCPIFYVQQRFNKKKLVVEMTISQRQLERQTKPPFAPNNFLREVKEHVQGVWASEPQAVFTGPMTIRIHEADGTPYEHIVEIKEQVTRLEIPYNTKYKRLKRSRRHKERTVVTDGAGGEEGNDSLLYCLGDILDTPEEAREWNLIDWTADDEEKMGQESYEWIRMDADFEWIGRMHLVMPLYMYISQLQQDRDLVAQYESMKYLLGSNPHHVSLSILLRTLMDHRYFHGIRAMAAEGLAVLASNHTTTTTDSSVCEIGQFHLQKAFQSLFCFPGEVMPKPNDWSDRTTYLMQCAIPRAMSRLRDKDGKVPMPICKFFVDKLKFNDNSTNPFSDCHYISTLMNCLADAIAASHRTVQPTYTFSFGDDNDPEEPDNSAADFEHEAIDEIERYRRIDEWVTTYHNIYSTTALDCLRKLAKAGVVKDKTKEVLQYTRASNADLVRLKAFECLIEIGVSRRMPTMKYLLHSLAEEPSSLVRTQLIKYFGEALGHIALDDTEPVKGVVDAPMTSAEDDGQLLVEQEVNTESRQLELSRKTTPEGAIAALKLVLGNEEDFQRALWFATTSPYLTIDEAAELCDVAALLYEPVASLKVITRLPRSYRCERIGKGKVRFIPYGKYRDTPRKPLGLEDWELLQAANLRYSGILSTDIKKRKALLEEQKKQALLDQIALLSGQREEPLPMAVATQADLSIAPPPPAPAPAPERSGFKLSLGGSKRKSSVDIGGRAGSPKAIKLSHSQTAVGNHDNDNVKRRPSDAGAPKIRVPTPKPATIKQDKKGLVRLRFNRLAADHAEQILSRPPRPESARPKSIDLHQSSQSPAPPLAMASSLFSPGVMQSPSGTNFFSASPAPPSSMNLGGFRTYGAAGDGMTTPVEVKKEPSPAIVSTVPAPVDANGGIDTAMPPPPKKKLTIKLGPKPPQPSPSPS